MTLQHKKQQASGKNQAWHLQRSKKEINHQRNIQLSKLKNERDQVKKMEKYYS